MSARSFFDCFDRIDRFDPRQAQGGSDRPEVVSGGEGGVELTEQSVGPKAGAPRTVSDLLADIKAALAEGLPQEVVVVGEVSNFKRHGSGHLYFSLKDTGGQISAVMFRAAASRLRFEPEDGLQVVASGRVDVYEAQGKLQLYVERLLPQGAGALELAFRQLVQKLQAEGLFDAAHKKPLPGYPERICVITSATGAAIRDIRRTLARRWPAAAVYLILTAVQGESAAGEIARAVRAADANAERLGLDVLIVARGGGSVEDLWSFNAEAVARAIFDCRVPVISGVGHEIDTTIADMVADVRAATPTAAAELATPDREQLRRFCRQQAGRMRRGIGQR
ncbi:MAG: exodeoxyribonuclease VII large subunit, partial [Planctomycetes bacterium]|nr:exodeoxyribonuclease VII large subunit [Planctomycetota bacterium]